MAFDSSRNDQGSPKLTTGTTSCSSSSSRFGLRTTFPKQLSDKYQLGEELGRGAYGRVFRGWDDRTGAQVAIKQLSLEHIPASTLAGIMTEVDLLKALNHRNVVQYMGSYRSRSHLYIIMELVERGSLAAVIKGNEFGPFPESLVAIYIQQVLQGLHYLHDQGVVHRDIKGANILITKEGLVKLADFGVAARLGDGDCKGIHEDEHDQAQPAGTPYWMAPEVVELKTVTTASDIWSVGCLSIELLTGKPPYFDLQPLSALYNIVQDDNPPLPPMASALMKDFLLRCFRKDPAARPSAKDLLQHHWIAHSRRTLESTWGRTRGMKSKAPEAHATVASVVERILSSSESSRPSLDSDDGASPKHAPNGAAPTAVCDSDSGDQTHPHPPLLSGSNDRVQQEVFLERLEMDATGAALLSNLQDLKIGAALPSGVLSKDDMQITESSQMRPPADLIPATPQDEGEVRRHVASLRIMASPGADRSLVEEAAAAASARALVGYITNSQALRRTFCAADGLSGLRELLDNSSERVLSPTMDLLLALTAGDADILEAACALGLVPAALRLTGAQHAAHLRLAAANFACLLARTSATTTHMLVACQGIPFFLSLMDEAPQAVEQLELLGAAMSGFWALLYRTATPGWWIRTNQYLRLMAHHGLPQRIVRVLPWALKHATTVAKASSSSSGSISMAGQQQSGSCLPSNSATKSASLSVRGMSHGNRIVPEDIERAAHSERGVKAPLDPGTGTALVESLVNLFAAMTHGDVVVKSRCCHCETINALFGLTVRMAPPLQLQVLRAVRRLSGEQSVQGMLEAANVVAYVSAQLPREDCPALQAEALCSLYNFCQLSRSRQERAADAGVVPWLCRLAMHPPLEEGSTSGTTTGAARTSCIAVLCTLAHCSPKTRAELWARGALDILLQLLKEEAHQAAVLEGLASWLDAELPRIEGRLLEDTSLARLVLLLNTGDSSSNSRRSRLANDVSTVVDQLPNILSPLCRMAGRSPRLAVALASAGLAARATELLKRPPSPPTALALMELLRLMYEVHPSPKEFISQNRVGPALVALAAGAQAGDQVLVSKQANSLLQAFSVNTVF